MSTLKEQYAIHKQEREQKSLNEVKELLEMKFLSFEKLTPEQANSIAEAVYELEAFAESLKDKVPALLESFEKPEKLLVEVVKGKVSKDKVEDALAHYTSITEFFGKNLPKLLDESEAFEAVRKNPTIPLSKFGPHVSGHIEKTWNKTTGTLLGALPMIELKPLSDQIMGLSYAQIKESFVGMPKKEFPLVLTESQLGDLASEIISLQEGSMLMEQGNVQALVSAMDKVSGVVNKLPKEFAGTKAAFQQFLARFQKAAAGGITVLNRDARLIAQANLVVNMFNQLGKLWPNMEKLFSDTLQTVSGQGNLEGKPDESKKMDQLKAALVKQLGGGLLAKMGRLFGKGQVIYPGNLTPQTLVNDMVSVLLNATGRQMPAAPGGVPPSPQMPESKKMSGKLMSEDLEDLRDAMKLLATVPPPAPAPLPGHQQTVATPPAGAATPTVTTSSGAAQATSAQPGIAQAKPAAAHPNIEDVRGALAKHVPADQLEAVLADVMKAVAK